ncbi:MAG: UDP-N-acetylglucosamine 2-epimerase (hydrolyzing) [Cyanobacteria bacterium]|nr:UDP-N-acetylglucosamine 2-epimerase (hydrolyzing) [Cyanobacteriota bacterium]
MRRIALLSGARSEYDILVPVGRAIQAAGRAAASFILAGPNLSPYHGRADGSGVPVRGKIESFLSSDSWEGRALSFANLVEGLARHLAADRPDILVVAGDREEALAGAIVGNLLRVPVAHVHGGDRCIASDVDELFRPAISKLSHLHFTATEGHRERLIKMGESPDRVWATGAPGLDALTTGPEISNDELSREAGFDVSKPFFIVIQHPVTTMNAEPYREMATLLDAVAATGHPILCSYPNTDPGNVEIRKAIDERKARGTVFTFTVLPRAHFIALYRRAAAIVGNSSSIVVESGFLQVPGILVGPRQDLRETADNVVRVPVDAAAIRAACERALNDAGYRAIAKRGTTLYGDGHASSRIAERLATVDLSPELTLKTMPY